MDINELVNTVERLYKFNPEITVSQALVFLFVARRGVAYQKDIELAYKMTGATASRLCSVWTGAKVRYKQGYGYMEFHEDVNDRRYKILRLNKTGEAFYLYLVTGKMEIPNGPSQG